MDEQLTSDNAAAGAPAMELDRLTKTFGATRAVDGVDLAVPAGSFTGLVGPNGAGKTTALSMAVGLLRPSGGSARISGIDIWSDPVGAKTQLGVLPDGLALPERLTGAELLGFWGRLRGLDRELTAARTAELLRVLELDEAEAGGTILLEYSTGMRKKIGLATALLHRPRVLVLDEPYEAVDPVSARVLTTILRRFTAAGGSIVMSSHVMPLVESLCDRVAIMTGGRIVADGTLDEVRAGGTLEDRFVALVGDRGIEEGELAWLAS